jgi:hypothetical protein
MQIFSFLVTVKCCSDSNELRAVVQSSQSNNSSSAYMDVIQFIITEALRITQNFLFIPVQNLYFALLTQLLVMMKII